MLVPVAAFEMADKFFPLNDAEKKLLSDRYLDLHFEQDIDDFVCVRCDRLAIVHFFTNCGHLLCLNCKRIIDNGGFTCPQCNTLITNAVLDKINDLNGKIAKIDTNMTKVNEYNVAMEKYKEDLKMELRGLRSDVNIEIRKRQEDIDQLKKKIIGEIQLSIEINLKKLIADEFREMKKDIKKNDLEVEKMSLKQNSIIKKEIESINEKVKDMKQQEVQLKEKLSNIQLPRIKDPIEELLKHKSSVQQLVDCFLFGSAEEQMDFESLCLKWTIKHLKQLIPKEGSHEHLSDIFPVYGHQLKAQLKLSISSDGDICLELCFKDEEREGQEVDIKPLPMVSFIIKDLRGQNKHLIQDYYSTKSIKYNEYGYGRGYFSIPQWNALVFSQVKSLEVLALVEPMTIISKPLSVNGTITDTIRHYSRRLQMEKEGLTEGHVSPPFLTHADGFRVIVEMHLNGTKFKSGLVTRMHFMVSEFDSQVGSDFEHETSVTLINQFYAKKNITVKKQAKNANSYDMVIVSKYVVSSEGFIVNDSLTYHVTMKPIK